MSIFHTATISDWLKGAYRSLTIWFNTIGGTIMVALPSAQDALPQLSQYLGQDAVKWVAGIVIIGNILLRAKTNKSLPEKGQA